MVVKAFETITLARVDDGSDGAPGKPGADGKTPYFHQAWADSKDGKIDFSTTDPTSRGYLGTYSDFTQADSNDPSKYYWVELVGNLQVGGRNYFLDSKTRTITPPGTANWDWRINISNDFWSNPDRLKPNNIRVSFTLTAQKALTADFNSNLYFSAPPWWAKPISYPAGTTAPKKYELVFNITDPAFKTDNCFIRFQAKDTSANPFILENAKLEIGTTFTDWSPAPEDTQEQFTQTNDALIALNDVFDKTVVPVASITAPPSPKEGQGWWVLNSAQEMIGFKIYRNGTWIDAQIQQSAMNIGTLNGNIINGATINTSDFNMSFDQTNAMGGVNKKGTTTIENGEIKTDFQIKNTTQTGYVHLTPEGLSTGSTKPDGTEQNSVSLAFGQIDLATTVTNASGVSRLVKGSLNAEDMEKSLTTYWESGPAGVRQKFWAYKQFRRVVLTGVIWLPAADFGTGGDGYRTIFNITDTSLRPLTTRWVKCSSFGNVPHLGLFEFRPNGDVVAIGVPSEGRYSFEGESYAIENL